MPFEIKEILDFGVGFWQKNRLLSDKEIDKIRGQNIPHNSKAIDRTISLNCIVSHKSTDLRRKSYKSPRSIYRFGMQFVHDLKNYKGEIRMNHNIKATYNLHWATEDPNCSRILEWFIPFYEISEELDNTLQQIIADSLKIGVTVYIYKVLDYN